MSFRDYTHKGEIVSLRCAGDRIQRSRIIFRYQHHGHNHYVIQREGTQDDRGLPFPECDLMFDGGKAADEWAKAHAPEKTGGAA